LIELSDTLILDLDKQLTFDTARLEYQHSSSLFFLDIDELVFPITPTSPKQQIEEYFRTGPKTAENWRIRRSNVAGTTDTLKLQPDSALSRSLVPVIEKCVVNGESLPLPVPPLLPPPPSCLTFSSIGDSECHQDAVLLLGAHIHANIPQVSRHALRVPFLLESLLLL
jgi:hypothetical protein